MNSELYKIKSYTHITKPNSIKQNLDKETVENFELIINFEIPKNDYGSRSEYLLEWKAGLKVSKKIFYFFNYTKEVEFEQGNNPLSTKALKDCLLKLYDLFAEDFCKEHNNYKNLVSYFPKTLNEEILKAAVDKFKSRLTNIKMQP